MATSRNVVILEALETPPAPSQNSTIIFLHGLGDDGRGTGYGLAQQFQTYRKLPHTKWVLPTAHVDPAVGQRCWYKPHRLPSPPLKPQVSGGGEEEDGEDGEEEESEDEEGILETVAYIDTLVADEVARGVAPGKIVVGGFSQGGAVSMIWGLKGEWREKVAGVCGLSGYFPKIQAVESGGKDEKPRVAAQWFFGHGMSDMLVSTQLFAEGQKRLQRFVDREKVEGHVYDNLAHEIGGGEIRDVWLWLKKVLPADE